MTNEDAIKWLDNLKNDLGNPHYECLWPYAQALDEICENLKEQEPKPVKFSENAYGYKTYYCPKCGRWFEFQFNKSKYCDQCGQAVKWDG